MKIPNRIKVKGKFVEIVYQHNYVQGQHLGTWDPNANVITIASGLSEEKTMEIFLHECLHMYSTFYDLKLTEKQVEGIDGPLNRLFKILSSG